MPFVALIALVAVSAVAVGEEVQWQPGLVAKYADDAHQVMLTVPAPNAYLEPGETAHPTLHPSFTAEYHGFLQVLQAGAYRFTFPADQAEFRINGNRVGSEAIELSPGYHELEIIYVRSHEVAELNLWWSAEFFYPEPVPADRFYHKAGAGPGADALLVEQGRELVQRFGCVNCHEAGSSTLNGRMGPVLTGVGSRVEPEWMFHWLGDPQAFRDGAVMPAMLTEEERSDVAAYLATLGAAENPVERAEPVPHDVTMGRRHYRSIGCAACHEQPGLGLAGMGSKTSVASLTQYLLDPNAIEVSGVMPDLSLSDEEAYQLAAYLTDSRNEAFEQNVPAGDAARGKQVIARRGCLACHELKEGDSLRNTLTAPKLSELKDDGCLAEDVRAGLPRYALTQTQREAMRAFISSYSAHPDKSAAPAYEFYRHVERMRCTACHVLHDAGPSVQLTTRPPDLTIAGRKLRTSWLEKVIVGDRRIRPWMSLRMPQYRDEAVEGLIPGFAKASGVAPGEGPEATSLAQASVDRGVHMIGDDGEVGGLGCIRCHDWGDHRSLGEPGPQLRDAAERLRADWFRRWMLQPARIQSGTSMPAYFTDFAPPDAEADIAHLWAALELGEDMPLPAGLAERGPGIAGSEEVPIPGDEAVVVRWFMPEATPAATAVGMPGGVSYVFDASYCRLLYAWSGGFVDMTPTLEKNAPPARLIGDIFYRSGAQPLRIGARDRIPEVSFNGYRIVEGHPQFLYTVDGVNVRQRVVPTADGRGVTQEFEIDAGEETVWYVLDTESAVTATSTVGEFEAGALRIAPEASGRFDVTILPEEDPFFAL